jgi:hypothetical protein
MFSFSPRAVSIGRCFHDVKNNTIGTQKHTCLSLISFPKRWVSANVLLPDEKEHHHVHLLFPYSSIFTGNLLGHTLQTLRRPRYKVWVLGKESKVRIQPAERATMLPTAVTDGTSQCQRCCKCWVALLPIVVGASTNGAPLCCQRGLFLRISWLVDIYYVLISSKNHFGSWAPVLLLY